MAIYTPIGIPFSIRKDWKKLFGGHKFVYQEQADSLSLVLRDLTILNVFKWYFYQLVIVLLMRFLRPLALIARHYWWDVEGKEYTKITETSIRSISDIKFFRLK